MDVLHLRFLENSERTNKGPDTVLVQRRSEVLGCGSRYSPGVR